ncbi:PKD domain-containing protein [Solirubrobacter ginsenosidimutans]|uniref:PKD domain-containing protein n=1 Tax=Solirubrobacter ginsenosidimutans TaxID=490573 RepID=A0A9X3RYM0_9ACTN|nr:PKD domain-containing protein [Solirubrobacter ginsenosidimutans]MDA0159825.1 PKD domain-containing protein [Solirubrobacter ginsenosidimutans]
MSAARGIARAVALAALAGGLSGCCQSGWTNFIFRAACSDESAGLRVKLVAPDEPVIAGRPVRLRVDLTATNPFPGQASFESYYWDLDGDRVTDRRVSELVYGWSTSKEIEHQFPRPGRVRVGVELVAGEGRDSDALLIDVQPPPGIESAPPQLPAPSPSPAPPGNLAPTASFVARAEVPVKTPFALDATGSSDADGRIVRYRWDMEGNAAPERESSSPITEYSYVTAGTKTVTLTVVDDRGATGQAVRTIVVAGARGGARATAAAARTFSAQVTGLVPSPAPRPTARGLALPAMKGSGTMRAGLGTRVRALRRLTRSRWRGRLRFAFDRRTGTATLTGKVLATGSGRRPPRACLRVAISAPALAPPSGTLTVLGGTRSAARLRGSAHFTVARVAGKTAHLRGTHDFRTSGRPRGLAACR